MTVLVPFDGSALSTAALRRASEFASFTDEAVVALTVIPPDVDYAERRGWLTERTPFEADAIAERLEQKVREVAPEARFRYETTGSDDPVATTTLDVVRTIRQVAAEEDATILFVGSENAGRVASPLSSVGNPLSEDPGYDIHIVRHAD